MIAVIPTGAFVHQMPTGEVSGSVSEDRLGATHPFSTRLGGPNGSLPTDFFHVPVPQGFAAKNPNSFDITTLNGFKLYRLRQAYGNGFGQLRELGQPRYIQFGLKIYF